MNRIPLEQRDPDLAKLRAGIDDPRERLRASLRVIGERHRRGQFYRWDLGYNGQIFWMGGE